MIMIFVNGMNAWIIKICILCLSISIYKYKFLFDVFMYTLYIMWLFIQHDILGAFYCNFSYCILKILQNCIMF